MERSPQQDFSIAEAVILLFISFILYVFIGILLALLWPGKVTLVIVELLVVMPVIFAVGMRRKSFRTIFRFHRISARQAFYTFVLTVSAFVLLDEMDRIVTLIFPMPEFLLESVKTTLQVNSLSDGILLLLSGVVIAGFGEEMLFRGFLQRTLEKHLDPALGIVLTAIAFALLHLNPWSALQITAIGLLLGFLTWKSQSLWPAVFLHAVNNLVSIILLNSSVDQVRWYCSESHVNFIWLVGAAVCFVPAWLAFNQECQKVTGGN